MNGIRKSIFYDTGNWYKGNLHSHTTRSDGKASPERMARAYKEKGYSFIAFTDHLLYYNEQFLNTEDFIYIPGTEVHFRHSTLDVHINFFLGNDEQVKNAPGCALKEVEKFPLLYDGGDMGIMQKTIDDMRSRGCIAVLNHPVWSYMEPVDAAKLEGFTAIEVFNGGCETYSHTGYASDTWDHLLRRGIRVWGIAADDNHNFFPYEDHRCESFTGWVVVKARSLTHHDIMSALMDGSFYASQGPEIFEFEIDGDTARVKCSPVERIYLMPGKGHDRFNLSPRGKNGQTEFECKLKGDEIYVRAECIDSSGRRAFSNPIFLDS